MKGDLKHNVLKTSIQIGLALLTAVGLTNCKRSAPDVKMSQDQVPSFQEVLKDGKKRDQAFAMMEPQVPSTATTDELRAIVRGYAYSKGQSADYWKVVSLLKTDADRLTPLLIEIVLEPNSESRSKELEKDILFETPLKRALMRLERGSHSELLPRLLELSRSDAPFARRDIAAHVASFGSDAVIPAIQSFLSKPDAPEVSMALMGTWEALKAGRTTAAYREAMFDPLEKIVIQGVIGSDSAAGVLLALDRVRGEKVLLNLLDTNDLRTLQALKALNGEKIPVDPNVLLNLLEENENPGSKEMWRYSLYGSALLGLARQDHPAARLQVEKILAEQPSAAEKGVRRFENTRLRRQEAASEALLVLEHFTIPSLWDRYEKLGRNKISEVERDLASMADAEISNGGMSQYFFNIDYDPREDVATMKRIGAIHHAAILEKSFKAFGWWGPAANREKRMDQLEKMSESKSAILDACDEEWFSSIESLDVLTNLYTLKHRKELEAIAANQSQ